MGGARVSAETVESLVRLLVAGSAVLAAQPNDVGMLYDLANCHEKSGDNAKAIAVYKRYVQAIRAKDAAAAERGEARIKALEKSAF